MSDPKKPEAEPAIENAAIENAEGELSEEALEQVSGGTLTAAARPAYKVGVATQDITVNKAKTADKAYAQMDAYIKQ